MNRYQNALDNLLQSNCHHAKTHNLNCSNCDNSPCIKLGKDWILTLQEAVDYTTSNSIVEDLSDKYKYMIEAFECDFSLIEQGHNMNFKALLDENNRTLIRDIALIKELSFGLRQGYIKIIKSE